MKKDELMKRREFIAKSGILSAGVCMAGTGLLASCTGKSKSGDLAKHVIDRVEFGKADYHWPRPAGKNARIGPHGQHHKANYIKLFTDQGAIGWGVSKHKESDQESLRESIMGKTMGQLIIPSEGIASEVNTVFDIALHDLAGVILDQPVYKMLGAEGPMGKEVYSGMIYFDELEPEENPAGIEKVMTRAWRIVAGTTNTATGS